MFVEVNILLHAEGPCLLISVDVHVCVRVCVREEKWQAGVGGLTTGIHSADGCLLYGAPFLLLLSLSSSLLVLFTPAVGASSSRYATVSAVDPTTAVNPVTQYCCVCVCSLKH